MPLPFFPAEMPRKLRFYQPKRYERKKRDQAMSLLLSIPLTVVKVLPVSVPLHLVNVPKLVLSLPLSAYLTAPVTDLKHLSSRLASQSLPAGWTNACQNDCLIFAMLTVNSPLLTANATFLVKVDHDFSWTVSCHGVLIETEKCQALAAFPRRITCVSDVFDLLSHVHGSRICHGNPVEEFRELVDVCGGEFRDSSGIL